jgi:hypothetical protein
VTSKGYGLSFWGDENVLKLPAVMDAYSMNALKALNCTL